jgi:predicted RNA-binding protein with PUA-like domain
MKQASDSKQASQQTMNQQGSNELNNWTGVETYPPLIKKNIKNIKKCDALFFAGGQKYCHACLFLQLEC